MVGKQTRKNRVIILVLAGSGPNIIKWTVELVSFLFDHMSLLHTGFFLS